MLLRWTVKNIRVTFTIAQIRKVIGVNSELEDGKHILMWDFDNVSIDSVLSALKRVQTRYFLSAIHILETKKDTNYIAYCFSAQEWRRACEIVGQTEYVDWNFFRFGVYRGHFTLRVTPKDDREIRRVQGLIGYEQPDCSPPDLKSWTRYETLFRR